MFGPIWSIVMPKSKIAKYLKSLFNENPCRLTAAQFREVWMHYDTNNNGYIEETEIDRFLIDLFEAQV